MKMTVWQTREGPDRPLLGRDPAAPVVSLLGGFLLFFLRRLLVLGGRAGDPQPGAAVDPLRRALEADRLGLHLGLAAEPPDGRVDPLPRPRGVGLPRLEAEDH